MTTATAPPQFILGLKHAFLTVPGVFVFLCFLAPSFLEWVDPTITATPLNPIHQLTAWPVLLWFAICGGVIHYTFHDKDKLDFLMPLEITIASWYLINGFFFNSMMDVFAGQFQSWSGMTEYYNALEPRYAKVGTYDGVTVQLTSWQELLIQTPCGLLLFYGYWTRQSWRYPLELIFNCWSVAGVWYFYLSEPLLNFPHVHAPFDDQGRFDSTQAWTFETLWKFWIGFVIFPGLWTVVGVALMYRSFVLISFHMNDVEDHFITADKEMEEVQDDLEDLLVQLAPETGEDAPTLDDMFPPIDQSNRTFKKPRLTGKKKEKKKKGMASSLNRPFIKPRLTGKKGKSAQKKKAKQPKNTKGSAVRRSTRSSSRR